MDEATTLTRAPGVQSGRLRAMTLSYPAREVAGFERMSRIYNAIEKNDPAQAKQAVFEHLTEAAALAKQILTEQE